jgi:dipeptidyl aminopeptidase/acylaminoacyl peptidase
LAVDRVDINTGKGRRIEQPRSLAAEYITDGHGNISVIGFISQSTTGDQYVGRLAYSYRDPQSHELVSMGKLNTLSDEGFNPYYVDAPRQLAFGMRKHDGRLAVYSKSLTEDGPEELVYARPDVDVGGIVTIGRHKHVIGVSYTTDAREIYYLDPTMKAVATSLSKALPKAPMVSVIDSSDDEQKLLIFAGSDVDPGRFYLLDRKTKKLQVLMEVGPQLAGMALANVKSVKYPAADGTMVPAYLTLPPGKESAKGLSAIVMPHGGPSDRDEWGFSWLPQYYAARGYAVIQPEFRGSSGFGDDWFRNQGFKAWRVAVGDVGDAGRWLVAQGIADPKKLAIVGWSYGGYAAYSQPFSHPVCSRPWLRLRRSLTWPC